MQHNVTSDRVYTIYYSSTGSEIDFFFLDFRISMVRSQGVPILRVKYGKPSKLATSMVQSDAHAASDQEVADSVPAGSIMK